MRPAGHRIAHHFAIAVIGRDQQRAILALDRVRDPAEPGIDRFDRLDRGGQASGVTDHVGIGEVEHDQVVLAGLDRRDRLAGQLRRGHLGLQVVGRDLRRGDHDAVLAGIVLLAAAIEEVGDVRVLLGLGHAQLRAPGARDDLAQDVRQRLRREERLQERVQLFAVLGHAGGGRDLDDARRGKPENSGSRIAASSSRTRSARKLKQSTPSPSRMP